MILSVHGGLFRGVFFGTAFSIGETRTELTHFPPECTTPELSLHHGNLNIKYWSAILKQYPLQYPWGSCKYAFLLKRGYPKGYPELLLNCFIFPLQRIGLN